METIHYISDFTYFSGRKVSSKYNNVLEVLEAHIGYIGRKAKNIFTFNLNLETWLERAKREIRKRWDSRVALKFVMALPLETKPENVEEVARDLQKFIAENLNVPTENVSIAIHLHKGISGNYNPHAHILVYPRDKSGYKLRLDSKDLSEFHRRWQERLKELGYKIKKDPEPLPHLGSKLYYDKDAQELYFERKRLESLEKELLAIQRQIANLKNHSEREEREREGEERKEDSGIIDVKLSAGYDKSFFAEILKGKEPKDFAEKQKKELAKHFSRLGYSPNDKLAIVLVNHRENKVIQRFYTVREILSDKILRFLRAKNSQGYSIYASVNVLKDNALSRKKEDFKFNQKRIYLDLDSKNRSPKELIAQLYQYIQLKGLPQPTHIVRSSKGNYQVYWLLKDEKDYLTLEKIMENMNKDLELDHTQDVSRVFRLPFFRNKKPNKNDLVLNVDKLKVYMNGKEVGVIEATGKPVDFEPFDRFSMNIDIDLPSPKPLSIYREIDISADIQRFKSKIGIQTTVQTKSQESEQENLLKGYSERVADYWFIVESILEDIRNYIRLSEERLKELRKLIEIAFERNKDKSPSEVDLAFLGLVFSRYEGAPPDDLLKGALFVVYNGAVERGKVNPRDYLERTFETVERYWEQRIRDNNNSNDDDLSLDDDSGLSI